MRFDWLSRLRRDWMTLARQSSKRRRLAGVLCSQTESLEARVVLTWPTPPPPPPPGGGGGTPPLAMADSYLAGDDHLDTVQENKASVLANDTGMGGALTAVLVTGATSGTLSLSSNGHFVYTPTLGSTGSDSFTYKAFNGVSYSSPATVALTIAKPLSVRTNLDDRPSVGMQQMGPIGVSGFTGDVQTAHRVGDGYSLRYLASSDPHPVIGVESNYAPIAAIPNNFEVQWLFNGVAQTTEWYGSSTVANSVRFTVQADASALPTGRYDWQMAGIANVNGDTATRLFSGSVETVNLNESNIGDSWTVAELDRLTIQNSGVLLAGGDGVTAWFASSSGETFASPAGLFATSALTLLGDGSYRLSDKFGNVSNYLPSGLLTSRVDRNDNVMSFGYVDADGDSVSDELSSITDPFGRVTSFVYSSGLLSSVTDHAGRLTSISHDSDGRVTSIVAPDPDGLGSLAAPVTTYGYVGARRKLASVTDALSHTTQVQYDFAGRVSQVTDATNATHNLTTWQTRGLPNLAAGQGTLQNPMPLPLPYSMPATQTNPLNQITETRYDRFGNVTLAKDPLGNTTTWTRDANGLATQITQPDPDGSGSLIAPVTQFQYDARQNLTLLTNPGGSTRSWSYDATLNTPLSATDELNRTATFTYDANGNLLTSTTPLGAVTSRTYNTRGQTLTETSPDPDGSGPLVSSVISLSYDSLGRLTTITNPDASTQSLSYDAADRVISQTDELGRVTSFEYDNLDRTISITQSDPDGSGPMSTPVTTLVYNAVGNVISQSDPLGRVTSFNYDVLNRRTQTTLPDPDGSGPLTSPIVSQAYDAAGRVVSQTDPLGKVTTLSFDVAGRVNSVTQPDPDGGGPQAAPVTSYQYDNLNRTTRVTDPLGRQTNFEYDVRSRLTKQTNPDPDASGPLTAPATLFSFNAASQLTSTTDPLGRITSLGYDANGRQVSVTRPDPDGFGPLQSPVLSMGYDAMNRITSQADPLGNVTSFEYDLRSRLVSQTQPDPDGSGPLSAPVTQLAFDVAGQMMSTTDPLGRVTSFGYDALGRQNSVTSPDPDGSGPLTAPVSLTGFDLVGNVVSTTDPLGAITLFEYDGLNRLIERTEADPDGSGVLTAPVTSFEYDAASRMTKLIDPAGNATTWNHDALGRVTSETNALGGTRSFGYDAVSNLTKRTDRNGRVIEFTYDNLDRLTTESWKTGSTIVNTISNTYDAASQLLSSLDASSELTFTYDNLGRVTQTVAAGVSPAVVLNNLFDAANRRTSVTATIDGNDDFTNSYQYDNLGRMTQVTQSGGGVSPPIAEKRVDLTYNPNGQFASITRYADLAATSQVASTTYSFDQSNRLTSLIHASAVTGSPDPVSLAAYSWTYDANSRITNATTPDGSVNYTYDNNSQLTGADHSAQADETYSYDANGNRTVVQASSLQLTYSTGLNNRLLSDGKHDFQYDAEGNRSRQTEIATGNFRDYTWDHRNRLTAITFKSASGTITKEVTYDYDTQNRRIAKHVDETGDASIDKSFHYVYDASGKLDPNVGVALDDIVLVFEDADGSGPQPSTLNQRLLHGPAIDQVFATESSANEVLWSLTDHQGTVRDWVSYDDSTETTTIVNHFRYDSFGQRVAIEDANGAATPLDSQLASLDYGYTGREWDSDASLNYYRARWYDPAVGRFISEDPMGFGGGDTNVNRYVGNGSTNATDPSGLANLWNPFSWGIPNPSQGWLGFVNPITAQNWNAAVGFGAGGVQGLANTANGVQNGIIAIPNLVPAAWNLTAGKVGASPMPFIPSPNWSANLIVKNDPTQQVSMFLGGQGVITLTTLGLSQLAQAKNLTHITSAQNANSINASSTLLSNSGQGVFALSNPSTSNTLNMIKTFGAPTGGAVPISPLALNAFKPIPIVGPISLWAGANGGFIAPVKLLNLATGAATPAPLATLAKPFLIDLGLSQGIQISSQTLSGAIDPLGLK